MRAAVRAGWLSCTFLFLSAAAPAPHLYAPGRYVVDAAATRVHFHVKSLIGKYEGDFVEPQGDVVIDSAHPDRAVIDIEFPVAKMTTGDASTDAMLKGDSFFDMEKFPTVRFAADDAPLVRADGETQISGQLTMHGQTQPATLAVRLTGVTPDEAPGLSTVHFTGAMTVERSRFGMGFGRPFVSNMVGLDFDAIFRRS